MNVYVSPLSTCALCLDDYDTSELNSFMTCDKCMDLQKSKELTAAVLLVIEWLTDNNVHTVAAMLEWNAGDLIETYSDTIPAVYNPDTMLKAYKAAQLVIYGTQ